MSKNKKNQKAMETVAAIVNEVPANVAQAQTAETSVAVLSGPIASETPATVDEDKGRMILIRPVSVVETLFNVEGEKLSLKDGVDAPNADEFAEFIGDRMARATTATSHGAYALYEAKKIDEELFNTTLLKLALSGISQTALANIKSIATTVIPFGIQQGYDAPASLLKDAVAAIRDRATGKTKTTDESIELQRAFKSGVNPDGTKVRGSNGDWKDVGGKPITTQSIRAIRDGFDKDGQRKVKQAALPAPATTEVRSATAANATGEPATAETENQAIASAAPTSVPLVDEKAPNSAGSVPATVGKPEVSHGTLSEGDMVCAKLEAAVMSVLGYAERNDVKKDERASIVACIKKLSAQFGVDVIGE